MSQPRTRPQIGQLGNRYAVVAAGSTCIEYAHPTPNTLTVYSYCFDVVNRYQPVDPNFPNTNFQQFCCGATNIDIFDLQGASSSTPATAYRADLPQQPSCTFTQARYVMSRVRVSLGANVNPVCVQSGSNCGICDLSSASLDGWYVMAGGQYSLNASDPDKVRLLYS